MSVKLDILIYLIITYLDSCLCFNTENLQDICGGTIYDEAGEVMFNAQALPYYQPDNECSVTINPTSDVLKEETRVLFYFTKFELTEPCETMKVKVLDGASFYGTRVEGLPDYICGHNTMLEEENQVFTTNSDRLTVTFRGSNSPPQLSGIFTIKFIAFHTGECEGDDELQCDNGRCVDATYACSDDVNACGDNGAYCEFLEDLKKPSLDILETLKHYLWVVPSIIVLCILQSIYKRKKDAICGCKDSICSSFSSSRREGRGPYISTPMTHLSTRNATPHDWSEAAGTESVDIELIETVQTPRRASLGMLEAYPELADFPAELESSDSNSFHSINTDDVTLPPPSAPPPSAPTLSPPPSYDELSHPPSYDDVINHATRYKSNPNLS